MAYIGREAQVGNFQVCDAISVVNGQAAYTMQVSSVNVFPETANHVLCSVNGILQRSGSSFTVSGSTITFASNLVTNDVIDFIHILGSVLDLGVPSDSTVSLAKLTATGTKDATTFLRGDNTFAAAGGTNTPSFFATRVGTQSISHATETKVQLNTVSIDTASGFDNSTNYRYTVPSGQGGKYLIICNAMFGASLALPHTTLKKNGSTMASNKQNADYGGGSIIHIETLSAGDYLEVFTFQYSSSSANLQGADNYTYLGGYKLIE